MSHKIAHLSLDFLRGWSVCGGERRCRRWTRTPLKSRLKPFGLRGEHVRQRGQHDQPPWQDLTVFLILLRSPSPPAPFGLRGASVVTARCAVRTDERSPK